MITKKLPKLLTISVIGLSIINGSYTEAALENCVRVVQFFGSVGVNIGQYGIKGKLNTQDLLKKLKAANLLNDKNQFIGLTPFSANQIQYTLTNGESTQAEPIQFVVKNAIDSTQSPAVNGWHDVRSDAYGQLTLAQPEIKTDNNGKPYIEVTAQNTFTGDINQVLPIVSSQNGAYIDSLTNDVIVQNPTDITKITTATQKIYVNTSSLPKYYFDNEAGYSLVQQFNEKNVWPGSSKEVQGSVELNLGCKFNLPQGGAIIFSAFGSKAFWNSTQKFVFGQENDGSSDNKTDENNNNNTNNDANWTYDIKDKGKLGFSVSVLVFPVEKVGIRLGIGYHLGWYDSSASSNDNSNDNTNINKTYLLKQKQNMRGGAPFLEAGILYNINPNFGVELFGRSTAPYKLKEINAKSDSDSNDNNTNINNNGISQSYIIKGRVEGGVRFVFMF